MKQIIAVIKPHMLVEVEHAVYDLPHFPGFTLLRSKGHGRGRAPGHAHHPLEWGLDEQDNATLLIVCSNELAPQVVEAIQSSAHTGLPGDGIISVTEAVEVVRIGSGERGDTAV